MVKPDFCFYSNRPELDFESCFFGRRKPEFVDFFLEQRVPDNTRLQIARFRLITLVSDLTQDCEQGMLDRHGDLQINQHPQKLSARHRMHLRLRYGPKNLQVQLTP